MTGGYGGSNTSGPIRLTDALAMMFSVGFSVISETFFFVGLYPRFYCKTDVLFLVPHPGNPPPFGEVLEWVFILFSQHPCTCQGVG